MTAVTEQLKDLAALLEKGLLTRAQFDEQRDRILAAAPPPGPAHEVGHLPAVPAPPPGPQNAVGHLPAVPGPPPGPDTTPAPTALESASPAARETVLDPPPPAPTREPAARDSSGSSVPLVSVGIGLGIVFAGALVLGGLGGIGYLLVRVVFADSNATASRDGSGGEGDLSDDPSPATAEPAGVASAAPGDADPTPASSTPVPAPPPDPDATFDDPLLDATAENRFAGHDEELKDYRRAVEYTSRRNTRGATPILDRLASGGHGRSYMEEVSLLQAANKVNQNLPDDALAELQAWKRSHPESRLTSVALLWEAKAHTAVGRSAADAGDPGAGRADYERAEDAFTSVIEKHPGDANACGEALFHLASVYKLLEQPDRQREAYDTLVATYPTHPLAPRGLYSMANAAWSEEDTETAERYFRKLADQYPEDGLAKRAGKNVKALAVVGQRAPELVVDHWIGAETSLEDQRGKVVLLVFWNQWCPHCKREMPKLQERWQTYRDRGLSVLVVTKHTKSQTDEKVKDYLDENGITLPCAVEPQGYQSTSDYAISGVPAAAVIDRDGTIVWRNHPARLTDERLEQFLDG